MKQTIIIITLFTLVSCTQTSSKPSKFKTIMLKAQGQVETLPDMASFHVNLKCLDKSVKTSKQCLVEKSNELKNKLLAFGINEKDLLTASVNLNKSYKWQNNSRVFEGYQSSSQLYVTVKEIENLDVIYTELMENQNLELSGLNYSHSQIDSLSDEAYIRALENAGLLSDKLLNNLPESKKEVLKIGNVEITSSLPDAIIKQNENYFSEDKYLSKNESISISRGTVEVQTTLFVEYLIR